MAGKILLVEASVSDQRMVETTLGAEFLDVVTVVDAASALDHLRRELPALILADLDLPDGSAPGLLERLRSDPRTAAVPVILLGQDAEALAAAVQTGGVTGILSKPLKSKDLMDRVYSCMQADDVGAGTAPIAGAERPDWLESFGDKKAKHAAADPFASDGDFDLAGALDTADTGIFLRSKAGLGDADGGASARPVVKPPELEGLEQTVVMRRDDLGALRTGLGVAGPRRSDEARAPSRAVAPAAPAAAAPAEEELDPGEAAPGDLDGFQTMIMSRDELSALRSKGGPAVAKGKMPSRLPERPQAPGARAPAAGSPGRAAAGGGPGSPESVEAMIRDAARATEDELLAVLGKLEPGRADAVKRVAGELVERVARRVATEVAERRVQEEIARIKRTVAH